MGIVSEIIPVFSRKPIFGYKAVAFSTVAIAFISMLVWAHHMFAVGLPGYLQGFFMISSMLVAVPTGVKIFNWLATTWRGNIHFDTPMLFALGFIAIFTIGGISGIFVAAYPFDWQVTDTYCTTSCSAAPSSRSSAGSTTGGRRSSAGYSTKASAS
jgi:cytochrome c oxidase subunit 1